MGVWQDHACKLLCMPCAKIAGRLRVASIFQRQGVRARTASRNELLFRETVSAIGAGGVITLQRLLSEHLRLVQIRLDSPGARLHTRSAVPSTHSSGKEWHVAKGVRGEVRGPCAGPPWTKDVLLTNPRIPCRFEV